MRFVIFFCILILESVTYADTRAIETCAFEKSRSLVQTISQTVGLTNARQVDGLLDLTALMCHEVIPANEQKTEFTTNAIEAGVIKAIREVMGASIEFPGFNSKGTTVISQSNLLITLKDSFADNSISILNPQDLESFVEPGEQGLRGNRIQLSNGYTCSVESKILSEGTGGPERFSLCAVKFNCQQGSSIKVKYVKQNCESFQ
jgi:hypothetical protein